MYLFVLVCSYFKQISFQKLVRCGLCIVALTFSCSGVLIHYVDHRGINKRQQPELFCIVHGGGACTRGGCVSPARALGYQARLILWPPCPH